MNRHAASDFAEVMLVFVLYSLTYLTGFLLAADLSFYRADAVLTVFGLTVLLSCARFAIRGSQRWGAFLAGVALSWSWLLIGVALLDWTVANGPSPAQASFYIAALRLLFTPEAVLVLLIPVSVVALASLLGAFLGLLIHSVRSRLRARSAI